MTIEVIHFICDDMTIDAVMEYVSWLYQLLVL